MQKVLSQAGGDENKTGVVRFGPELFVALLSSVPMAFQRSIEYRDTWHKVSALRRQVYMQDPDIPNEEQAMLRLRPPLRESEWALYAAACCNTALIKTPLYLQRCETQGYFSIPRQRERAESSNIDIKMRLLQAAEKIAEFNPWIGEIRKSLASAYFNQAYFYFYNGRRLPAYRALYHALKTRPTTSFVRFGIRMMLPRTIASDS